MTLSGTFPYEKRKNIKVYLPSFEMRGLPIELPPDEVDLLEHDSVCAVTAGIHVSPHLFMSSKFQPKHLKIIIINFQGFKNKKFLNVIERISL